MPARLLTVAAAALVAALPAPARAAVPWQVVAVPDRYVASEVYVLPGDTLFLTNADPVTPQQHDLRSTAHRNGVPLFKSPFLSAGQTGEVAGVAALPPGYYPFVCALHPQMRGNLHVGLEE